MGTMVTDDNPRSRPTRLEGDPESEPPSVTYRMPNGYAFWFGPCPQAGLLLDIRPIWRQFTVRAPSGQERECWVEVSPRLHERICAESRGELPPGDALWNLICRCALQSYLGQGTFPPERVVVEELP